MVSSSHHHLQPRVRHTSVFDSSAPAVPAHELPKIFTVVNLQSTAEESASKPDICSRLKLRQRPGS